MTTGLFYRFAIPPVLVFADARWLTCSIGQEKAMKSDQLVAAAIDRSSGRAALIRAAALAGVAAMGSHYAFVSREGPMTEPLNPPGPDAGSVQMTGDLPLPQFPSVERIAMGETSGPIAPDAPGMKAAQLGPDGVSYKAKRTASCDAHCSARSLASVGGGETGQGLSSAPAVASEPRSVEGQGQLPASPSGAREETLADASVLAIGGVEMAGEEEGLVEQPVVEQARAEGASERLPATGSQLSLDDAEPMVTGSSDERHADGSHPQLAPAAAEPLSPIAKLAIAPPLEPASPSLRSDAGTDGDLAGCAQLLDACSSPEFNMAPRRVTQAALNELARMAARVAPSTAGRQVQMAQEAYDPTLRSRIPEPAF
ncbi:hypothetical protein [Novosphingobium cyanobacteriorum]|uniref:Uncharacterized protein n=1 Tax=Novosphingobium cyanobacteriorum TaxID=3024215 RepID=A0ABT6CNV6_9SPHN|nr:hypothetical protein [Novosphingobium cyanobacteriorum]MDF8335547.1 hypothetical protein [Novosphingobium cyanobacteriorum]